MPVIFVDCSEELKQIAVEDSKKEELAISAYVRQLILRERKRKEKENVTLQLPQQT